MSRHFDPPSQVVILRQEIREENKIDLPLNYESPTERQSRSTKAVGCKQQITYLVERMVEERKSSRIIFSTTMIAAPRWGIAISVHPFTEANCADCTLINFNFRAINSVSFHTYVLSFLHTTASIKDLSRLGRRGCHQHRMESLSDTVWDVVICGTGLQQSLLAL